MDPLEIHMGKKGNKKEIKETWPLSCSIEKNQFKIIIDDTNRRKERQMSFYLR